MSKKLIRGNKLLYILCVTRFLWRHSLDINWSVALEVLYWALILSLMVRNHQSSCLIIDYWCFVCFHQPFEFHLLTRPFNFFFFPLNYNVFLYHKESYLIYCPWIYLGNQFLSLDIHFIIVYNVHEINSSQETTLYSLCNSFYETSIIGH